MPKDDAEVFEFTNPAKALKVVDRALEQHIIEVVTSELGLTKQAINAWRKGHVEQLSMKVARRVRRLDRRLNGKASR